MIAVRNRPHVAQAPVCGERPVPAASQLAAPEARCRLERLNAAAVEARATFRAELVSRGAVGAILGTLGALALVKASPVLGLLGLAGGTWFAVNQVIRRMRGDVELELDGETRRTHYYLDPQRFTREEREVVAELIAAGLGGDEVPVGKVPGSRSPAPELAPLAPVIAALAEERRLLADLGGKTPSGQPALQLVSGAEARDLLASGAPIYVVVAGEAHDQPHELRIQTHEASRRVHAAARHRWIERSFEYTLTKIESAADLERGIPPAAGVPAGMTGVYRDSTRYTLPIACEQELGHHEVGQHHEKLDHRFQTKRKDDQVPLDGPIMQHRVVRQYDARYLGAGLGILLIGGVPTTLPMLAGATIAGLAPLAVLLGGFAGWKAGELINRTRLLQL